MDDQTGNFEVGKDFDALRVKVDVPDGPIDIFLKDLTKVEVRGRHNGAHLLREAER